MSILHSSSKIIDFSFIDEISQCLSRLALYKDKIIVIGDFNNQVDIKSDTLSSQLSLILDALGFYQVVNVLTHKHYHTLAQDLT